MANTPSLCPSTSIFTQEELVMLDRARIPVHVAIIPDGNRRWARQQQASIVRGHREGADILLDIVKAAKELGIKVITFYLFSTENWNRESDEVQAVLWLLETFLAEQQSTMISNGVRMESIGDLSRLPPSAQQAVQRSKEATAHCRDIDMVLALNYGARDEIRRAFQSMLDDYAHNELKKEEVTEAVISRYLDTSRWADPDLLIRTSGELRLSNFLLWQVSYSEIYISDVLWPDFMPQHLLEAIIAFQNRERRLGGP